MSKLYDKRYVMSYLIAFILVLLYMKKLKSLKKL